MNRRQFTKAMAAVASGAAAGLIPELPAVSEEDAVMTVEMFIRGKDLSYPVHYKKLLSPDQFAAVIKSASDELGQFSHVYVWGADDLLADYNVAVWDLYL